MSKLPDINNQFADWYQEVIHESQLVDSSPTKGCFVFRPYGYAIWENIQKELDKKIKSHGVENAYFPLLIPEEFLMREKKHVEGFSPELAVVTHGGGKELEEKLVVRPTSETMFYYMFSRWITSWRDLPMKINQWANVVRWEMRTRPFLRSLEFLWQEGHTAHKTKQEAIEMAKDALTMYKELYEDFLAVPVVAGIKSESEKFAGAEETYTLEGLMPDGKALQMCTSHMLAHSFPESFGVNYQDEDGNVQVPYCSSWGFTTRSIGAVVMTHGDENGLVLPPKVAPIQAVIVPIARTDDEWTLVLEKAEHIKKSLEEQGFRIKIDDDRQARPGAKFYHWEMRGVPVRMELGPRDLENNQVVLVNRIEKDKTKKKSFVSIDGVGQSLQELLGSIHNQLLEKARIRMHADWYQAEKLDDFSQSMSEKGGFYQVGWCGSADCEKKAKQFQGTIRCLLNDKKHEVCFACDQKSMSDVLIAKSY